MFDKWHDGPRDVLDHSPCGSIKHHSACGVHVHEPGGDELRLLLHVWFSVLWSACEDPIWWFHYGCPLDTQCHANATTPKWMGGHAGVPSSLLTSLVSAMPELFLHYFCSHLQEKAWLVSLIRLPKCSLLRPFTSSYKNLKTGYFKVTIRTLAGKYHFYDSVGIPLFPF